MKGGFWKTVLAVIVGLLITGIIVSMFTTCVFVGMIASASSVESGVATKPGDVMLLKINGEVTEVPSSVPFVFDMMGGVSMAPDLSLRGYLNAIACAKQDPNIAGIYLNTDGMEAAPASYEALHDALSDFRKSGKWIIAYNDAYSLGQYYIASAADSVYVNTIGTVGFDGLSTILTYPKGLLDKLGIEMQIFRVGTFKSAVEPYMIDHISDANRLQTETYLSSIWHQMTTDIAQSRNISPEALEALANQAVSYMQPEELLATGLVDSMLYKTDVEQILLRNMGQPKIEGHSVSAKQMIGNYETLFPQLGKQKIAVLYAAGEIASEGTGVEDAIYFETLIKDIRTLADDDAIKAVVFRVNSPGGSAFASEQIWKALSDLKAKKPLIVSMGDYAASGGYYISCIADYIVAEPTTLTGSIGVFGVIPNFSGLASGKLGVNFEEVKTHEFGSLHTMRAASPAEKQKVQRNVESTYDLFTSRCAEGRGLSQDSIKVVGGGRVWTGSDALQIGLVDELGGLDIAYNKAVALAGLVPEDCCATNYPLAKSSFETFMELLDDSSTDLTLRIADCVLGTTPVDRSTLRFIDHLQNADRIQARSFDAVVF